MKVEERTSIRALLINEKNKILMIRLRNPSSEWEGWITPGGGVESGETHEETLKRELKEELTLDVYEIIAPIWKRYHEYPWYEFLIKQAEVFYYLKCNDFIPKPSIDGSDNEMHAIIEYRWMSLEDLRKETLPTAPRDLANLVEAFLKNGIPENIIELSDN